MNKKSRSAAALDNVTFADEEGAEPAEVVRMSPERNRRNQEAARKVVEAQKPLPAEVAFPPMRRPVLPKMSAEEEAARRPKIYIVKSEQKIARGPATYVLKAGKRISSNDYDVADLRRQGVLLEEVDLA